MNNNPDLLSVQDIKIEIKTKKGPVYPVRGLSFSLKRGQSLCIVGESGCGKSVTALSVLGLLPKSTFRLIHGKILFDGTDLVKLPENMMRDIRGRRISMVFQDPMTALNPVFSIGEQIREAIVAHGDTHPMTGKTTGTPGLKEWIVELLGLVGIPEPDRRYYSYPHELSGGLRQRAMMAMALACGPDILIADEPTTALDVTIQAQILNLIRQLKQKSGLGLVLITHNLGVVAQIAEKVLVMYAGKAVEEAPVDELFEAPFHPYTKGLMESVPYGLPLGTKRLRSIKGNVPPLDAIPSGCAFQSRCTQSMEICQRKDPPLSSLSPTRKVACHLYTDCAWKKGGARPTVGKP